MLRSERASRSMGQSMCVLPASARRLLRATRRGPPGRSSGRDELVFVGKTLDGLLAFDLTLEPPLHVVDGVGQHVVSVSHGVFDILRRDVVAGGQGIERLADHGLGLRRVAPKGGEAIARVAARLPGEGPACGQWKLCAHHAALRPVGFFLLPAAGRRSAPAPRLFLSAAMRSMTLVSSFAGFADGLTDLPLRFWSISARKASS